MSQDSLLALLLEDSSSPQKPRLILKKKPHQPPPTTFVPSPTSSQSTQPFEAIHNVEEDGSDDEDNDDHVHVKGETAAAISARSLTHTNRGDRNERIEKEITFRQHQCITSFERDRVMSMFLDERQVRRFEKSMAMRKENRATYEYTMPSLPTIEKRYPNLHSYQHHGVHWMLQKYTSNELGVILGDEMGLGKTAQVVCFLDALHRGGVVSCDGPSVVVVGVVTLAAWMREFARWAPDLRVVKLHGPALDRAQLLRSKDVASGNYDVLLTSPGMLRSDRSYFTQRIVWRAFVVDEAHGLKSDESKIVTACKKVRSTFRVALSGTPVQNNEEELWTLLGWLYMDYLVPSDDQHRNHIEDLARLVSHVMLRRVKADVGNNLPLKRIETVLLEPTTYQRGLTEFIIGQALRNKDGKDSSEDEGRMPLAGSWAHLRKAALHPLLFDILDAGTQDDDTEESGGEGNMSGSARLEAKGIAINEATLISLSAKMIRLDILLPELRKKNHRVVIFSTLRSMLDVVEAYCELRQYSCFRLDGTVPHVRREVDMLRFNQPDSDVFVYLVTTTAGGVGITLIGADTLILLDPHYNPTVDAQAIDRVHRIGQTKPVTVYRFLCEDSIDTRIMEHATRKEELGKNVLNTDLTAAPQSRSKKKQQQQVLVESIKLTLEDMKTMSVAMQRKHVDTLPTTEDIVRKALEIWISKLRARNGGPSVDCVAFPVSSPILPNSTTKKKLSMKVRANQPQLLPPRACFHCHVNLEEYEECEIRRCDLCFKWYCIECYEDFNSSSTTKSFGGKFFCPRHRCDVCDRTVNQSGGVMFMCSQCPTSYCFDDLDVKYYLGKESLDCRFQVADWPCEQLQQQGGDHPGLGTRKNKVSSVMYIVCDGCQSNFT
eukprot:PhF_6_TR28123/c0_g1_i1/m.41606/K11654/SMARCA5, SNF2H, ISWI; SWI/SNF-related matrix-associated actin-dependent regulator of chromatin subfamily A member 5